MSRYPFRRLYLADLDAIRGKGGNGEVIKGIKQRFPGLKLWVDEGICDRSALSRAYAEGLVTPVIGSETLADLDVLTARIYPTENRAPILSLDFLDERFLGPSRLKSDPSL